MRVSIVIPAYNEESHVRACLQAIAEQTVKPFEVIVVDNNSTDATAAIARTFPFVTLVSETRQGLLYARNAGFNAARGDIIGRIDADTRLAPDWVARVSALFARPGIDAVSGSIRFYDVPCKPLADALDRCLRAYLAQALRRRGELFLYGANMAIRRSTWQAVAGELCMYTAFHEDVDLAAHLAKTPYIVAFDSTLQAAVSPRRIDSTCASFYRYAWANSRTYAAHDLKGRIYMYPIQVFGVVVQMPLRFLYRSYDPYTQRFSLKRKSYRHMDRRVNPIVIP